MVALLPYNDFLTLIYHFWQLQSRLNYKINTHKPLNADWSSFGARLKYGREQAKLGKSEAAKRLRGMTDGHKITRRHIEFWEKIDSPDQETAKTKTRPPWPKEVVAMVELYRINGLWLMLYDREPNLNPVPPDQTASALYGRPKPRTELELVVMQKMASLPEDDLRTLMKAAMILGMW